MADSLEDIGTGVPFFSSPFNWAKNPSCDFELSRILNSFPGTVTQLETLAPQTPIQFKATVTIYERSDDYSLLEFIHTVRGRNIRFWVPYQKQLFKLVVDVPSGGSSLICEANNFQLGFQGYERIYIKMKNGDLLTRWVTSATSLGDTQMQIGLSTPLDRELTTTNHVEIGRLLLARFDSDDFEQEIETDHIYDIELTFKELVREYGEIS